ncbi:MAG: hypothetical protein U0T83_04465 [Bacteriovoracaceae bacterium]
MKSSTYDLQNEVYQLEDNGTRELWTCKVTAFSTTYSEEGRSKNEAENRTVLKCETENHPMHCEKVRCFKI